MSDGGGSSRGSAWLPLARPPRLKTHSEADEVFESTNPAEMTVDGKHDLRRQRHFSSRSRTGIGMITGESCVSPTPSTASVDDTIFELFRAANTEMFDVPKFLKALRECGLRYQSDPRLKDMVQQLVQSDSAGGSYDLLELNNVQLTRDNFKNVTKESMMLITKALQNQLIIPDWEAFAQKINVMYDRIKQTTTGKVATYIPQLAKSDPALYGISVCTVDGQRLSLGDCKEPFCLQSVSKAFSYAVALHTVGAAALHYRIGTEPSGRGFNEICLDQNDRPHNPMINAGAIVVASMLQRNQSHADRFDFMMEQFKRLAGGEYVGFNNSVSVFLSERKTADRNFALAYYMREHKVFPDNTDIQETMDFYFQLCSIETNADGLAVMGATLANGGVNPITGQQLLSNQACRDTLSLMYSCGMYDYSGMFSFNVGLPPPSPQTAELALQVGLPAKSGVSGAMVLVVPNVAAFAIFSPPLDKMGNTVKGVQFCEALVEQFNFHNYDNILHGDLKKSDPRRSSVEAYGQNIIHVLFAAKSGDLNAIKRYILQGVDLNQSDYDGRTALHLAASEGHAHVVRFLLDKWNCSPFMADRWGHTALDDAQQFSHPDCARIIERAVDKRHSEMQQNKEQDIVSD